MAKAKKLDAFLHQHPEFKELTLANESRPTKKKDYNPKRREILDFARDHNLLIHPGAGYDYYIEGFFKFGFCPCDKNRPNCPCPESVTECKEKGHCKCRLYWRSYDDFKDTMIG